jgi:hypothetical protein
MAPFDLAVSQTPVSDDRPDSSLARVLAGHLLGPVSAPTTGVREFMLWKQLLDFCSICGQHGGYANSHSEPDCPRLRKLFSLKK